MGPGDAERRSMNHADGQRRSAPGDLSLFGTMAVLLRHRRLVFGLPLLGLAVAVAFVVWQGRSYTSTTAFLPQTKQSSRSGLSGLASQFGLVLPTTDIGESSSFYVELLQSRSLRSDVASTTFAFESRGERYRGTLSELFAVSGRTAELRHESAIKELGEAMLVTKGRETAVVHLSITTEYAPLSQLIARRMLELVNQYNLQRRQSQAAAESRFISGRLAQAQTELRAAEDRNQAFLQRNRDYRSSPQLTFRQDRLQRAVSMRQEVFSTLSQLYEQARIEEVRDTPVITVIEQPPLPVKPVPRGLLEKGLLGVIVGGVVGVVAAFWLTFLQSSRASSPETFGRYTALRSDTLEGFRRPLRRVRRLFRAPR